MILSRVVNRVVIMVVAALLMSASLFMQHAHAAAGNIYLSPASASVLNGNTFTTNVRINPGTTIDTVDINLGFDGSKVTYQTITYAGSPFGAQLGFSSTSNSIHFTAGNLGGTVTTDSFVATVTFKAIAGSGTTALSLAGSNAAYAGTSTNPSVTGATITLTSPVATCPAGQTGTPPNCVTPTPPPTTTTPPPTTSTGGTKTSSGGTTSPVPSTPTPVTASNADIATKLERQDVQFTIANLVISTKAASQVYVRYGLDQNNLAMQTPLSDLTTSHTIAFDSAVLVPGQTYYYQVFSKSSQGQTVQSEITSFTTKGLTAKVGFFDKHNKPLANKKVSIHSTPQTATTDAKGYATFNDLAPGSHTVSYTAGGKTYSRPLTLQSNIQTVGSTQVAEPQSFSIVFDFAQANGLLSPLGLGLLAVAAIAIVGTALYLRKRSEGLGGLGDYIPTLNPVTVGGATNAATPIQTNEELSKRLESTPMPQSTVPGTVISSEQHSETGKED